MASVKTNQRSSAQPKDKMKNAKCEYDNDGQRITAPGKFEGEPVFAPHYWDMGLQGLSDSDDGKTYTFKFTTRELVDGKAEFGPELYQWLGRKRTLRIQEDSQGFVRCF